MLAGCGMHRCDIVALSHDDTDAVEKPTIVEVKGQKNVKLNIPGPFTTNAADGVKEKENQADNQ